jgi:hypothetical protein
MTEYSVRWRVVVFYDSIHGVSFEGVHTAYPDRWMDGAGVLYSQWDQGDPGP